jgi:hypothetical protein
VWRLVGHAEPDHSDERTVTMAVSTAAARRRGIKLSLKARKARVRAVQSRADARAADLAPIVREPQSAGVTSLVGIAPAFNERSIPTATGQGNWHAVQVSRVLARLGVYSKLRAPALCRASLQRGRGFQRLNLHTSRPILAAWPRSLNRRSPSPGPSTRSPPKPSALAPSRPLRGSETR